MAESPLYKLSIRFEVQKVMVDQAAGGRENYTGERLTIDSNLDLTTSNALVDVLRLVEQVQGVVGAAPAPAS